jgi:serine/threonine protein kinase
MPQHHQAMHEAKDEIIHEIGSGETIDGFDVGEILAESRLSTLYRVTHPDHAIPLVMKVPKLGAILPASVFSGFESEIHILRQLSGLYTPRYVACGDMASCPYLVMEFIPGGDLQAYAEQAPVSIDKLCELMIPVCRAINELHRHNVIHLDLTPQNVRFRSRNDVVIIDYGSAHHAKLPDMYTDAHEDAPNTLAYVAPEQLYHVRNDSRSDIYAIGVMCYQLATGVLPFGIGNHVTVKRRMYLPPLPPRAINKEVHPWLQEIILKCMAIDPNERYTSAKEVAYALSHPNMVALTKRARLTRRAGLVSMARSWLSNRHRDFSTHTSIHPEERVSRNLHILVAVELNHYSHDMKQDLLTVLRTIAESDLNSYFTCMSVLEKREEGVSEDPGTVLDHDHPPHIRRQVELRHWIRELDIAENRVNFQVYNGDPATEIVEYARTHVVDHIVIGAHGSGASKPGTGNIAARVAAGAPCSVTMVRSRRDVIG